MGLFSNNKKVCPLCGNPTPRLLALKVEDTPLCKECERKIDLPQGAINEMNLEQVKQYMEIYDRNEELRDSFQGDYRLNFGFLSATLVLDVAQRLFRLKDDDNAWVMDAENLKSFRILEDSRVLFEGTPSALKCYESNVYEKANAMSSAITQFEMRLRDYEWQERMDRERNQDDNEKPHRIRPTFDMPDPFKNFYVEMNLNHPYWKSFKGKLGAPSFDRTYPSVEGYLTDYDSKVAEMHVLAQNLMQIMNPSAPEIREKIGKTQTAASQMIPPMSGADEIQKYKALLDSGAITEEEFAAKKKQLLGI